MFAAIYVPDFPVEALVRADPELRERALAVLDGTPPLLRVAGVNERARQCGVELGMTALQAEERLRGVQQAQMRRRAAAQEQAAHAALLDCACACSPRVEDTAADTVLLDLAGLERLFGPPAKIARELARRVAEIGMEASVAVAANPEAAVHAARGFPGVTVIPPGKEAERLGELPVDVLAPEPELLETLDRWGVRNLRALAALPGVSLAQRLGQEGVRWQKLARGEGARPLRVMEPPLTFEEAVELEYPVALLEPLAFLLNRMLEQLCARLGARALAAQELRLRLELEQAEDVSRCAFPVSRDPQRETQNEKRKTFFTRTITLPVPMLDAKVFLKLLQLDLQAHPPGAPVAKIWLAAEPAEPRRAQSGLFVPVTPEAEKLGITLARLKAVVSRQSPVASELRVGSPEVLDTHRPDAFRMENFNPFVVAGRQSPVASSSGPAMTMRILRPPRAIAVELREGVPQTLRETGNGKRETRNVLWAAGPWRNSGDWWSEQSWAREEWDVAVQDGDGVALYRIVRDPAGAWFVDAEYD
jgi:protein ImuB